MHIRFTRFWIISLIAVALTATTSLFGSPQAPHGGAEIAHESGHAENEPKKYDPKDLILNHIGNANEFHLWGHVAIPLPCILYSKEDGVTFFMSSKLHHGEIAYKRYILNHGVVNRVKDASFPTEETHIEPHVRSVSDKGNETGFITYNGKEYELEKASNLMTPSTFYDFSISKNVFTMILVAIMLIWVFTYVANRYKKNPGVAPRGLQNFMEVFFNFILEEVAKPMLGDRYMKFLPYLMTIFFFILANNLLGLIPIFPGGANVTGNIGTTMALAGITFILVNINGNKDYWKHIFWMPGIPVPMKIFLAPIEFLGIFIKPVSLMIRLFANITAGHVIILALVGLIFVFGNAGQSVGGATAGALVAVPFTLFLNVIELIVALIQAFIFTILSASYLGAATESHGHDDHH